MKWTKETIQKEIAEMDAYLPVYKIEERLGMPPTTLQKVLSGSRTLPKKWEKKLEAYFVSLPDGKKDMTEKKRDLSEKKVQIISDSKIPPVPVIEKGEHLLDFAARKNEWKRLYSK